MVLIKNDTVDEFTGNWPNCVRSFYTTENNWYRYRTEVLSPGNCIKNAPAGGHYVEYETSEHQSEFSILMLLTISFTLLVLMWVNCRSQNPYYLDWYRVILYYLLGTYAIIVIFQINPSTPGFSRVISFGVMVHNAAEIYILKYLWYGRRGSGLTNALLGVIYMWLMTLFLVFAPINLLFFIAMLQGATLDYTLVFSYPLITHELKELGFEWNYCTYVMGAVGAVMHIISIQPLFFGMVLGRSSLYAATSIFLFPTFLFYTFFAARELGRVNFGGPSFRETLNYILLLRQIRDKAAESGVRLRRRTTVQMSKEAGILNSMGVGQTPTSPRISDDDKKNDKKRESQEMKIIVTPDTQEEEKEVTENTEVKEEEPSETENGLKNRLAAKPKKLHRGKTENHLHGVQRQLHNITRDAVTGEGQMNIFVGRSEASNNVSANMAEDGALKFLYGVESPIKEWRKAQHYWTLVVCAFITSFINSMIVWYSPCYLKLACNE